MKACDKASAVLEVTVSSYEVDKVLSTVDDSPGILYFFFLFVEPDNVFVHYT